MAQSNSQREPSMEEILASIRRIIESTDGEADTGDVTAQHSEQPAADELPSPPSPAMPEVATVDAFEDALNEPSETGPTSRDVGDVVSPDDVTPIQAPPVSLADVAARVRATADMRAEEARQPSPGSDQSSPMDHDPIRAAAQPTNPVDTSSSADETPVASDKSLVSSEVGARVAASFDDLAGVISNKSTIPVDQIAENMLRPMLQAWLDDNLPTLVERLVRDEIERVARGDRA